MRHHPYLVLTLLALVSTTVGGQDRSEPCSLIQVVASPEKFDGKRVTVRGFYLVVGRSPDVVGYFLYLHKEDAENNLGNSVMVVPNEQMVRDQEKFDRMHVQLTGTFHTVRTVADSYVSTIRDVTSSTVWSDPSHPIALKLLDEKHK